MKNTKCIHSFLALFLLAVLSVGVAAQSVDDPTNAVLGAEEIAAARNQYTAKQELLPNEGDRAILAQYPERGPGPFPGHGRYPRERRYEEAWMDHGNAAHVAIRVAIGFGIGATFGGIGCARNGTSVVTCVFLGGSMVALIGGAIGASNGAGYRFAHHRKNSPLSSPGDDEKDQEANHKPDSPRPTEELQVPGSMSATAVPGGAWPGARGGY